MRGCMEKGKEKLLGGGQEQLLWPICEKEMTSVKISMRGGIHTAP